MNTPNSNIPSRRATRPHSGQGFYYDPLYGHISLDPAVRDIIDLAAFQRLRRIRQLSTLYLVYHCGNHTRFDHSIGTAFLAGTVHEHLAAYVRDEGLSGITLNEITARAVELAGLLHDIGHGPFGHVFELFCRRHPVYHQWNHETWGRKLITGDVPDPTPGSGDYRLKEIPAALKHLKARMSHKHEESELLGLLEPRNIANIAFGTAPDLGSERLNRRYSFLKDIVPSIFGVDRLDYLRRDALFTGMPMGTIDVWGLIKSLKIVIRNEECVLGLSAPASTSLESLVHTRDAVYRTLYYNPIHRGFQQLLVRALSDTSIPFHSLTLMGDQELLDQLAQHGDIFSKDVVDRIQERVRYEIHPVASHAAFARMTTQIEAINKNPLEWRTLSEFEKELSSNVGFPEGSRVFIDIEKVPAISKDDLKAPILIPNGSSDGRSLIDHLEHFKNLYGDGPLDSLPRIELYNRSVSMVYIGFPYEYISDDIASEASRLNVESMDPQPAHAKEAALSIYKQKIEPLIVNLLEGPLKLNKSEESVNQWLSKLYNEFQEYMVSKLAADIARCAQLNPNALKVDTL